MASDRSKLLWERSVSLAEYATETTMADAIAKPLIAKSLWWQIPEILLRFGSRVLPDNDPVFHRIFADARRGKLIVTGFRREPTQSPIPVQVPRSHLARSQFRLLQNRIEGDGFAYDELRIIAYRHLPRQMRRHKPNQQLRSAQISATIKQLYKSGRLLGVLRKQQIQIVRVALENAGVENIGADKTIERLIRQITGPIKIK